MVRHNYCIGATHSHHRQIRHQIALAPFLFLFLFLFLWVSLSLAAQQHQTCQICLRSYQFVSKIIT